MRAVERVARVRHVCIVCCEAIEPGERYKHVTALPGVDDLDFIVDNKPTRWRQHLTWAMCDANRAKRYAPAPPDPTYLTREGERET